MLLAQCKNMSYIFYKFNIIALDWALKIDSLLGNNEVYNLFLKMFLHKQGEHVQNWHQI
jgi:hypothetical protein